VPRLTDLTLSRSEVDRAVDRRDDQAWLAAAWQHERTRVLLVDHGQAPVTTEPPALVWCHPTDVVGGERYLLGVDVDGVAYFAAHGSLTPDPAERSGLREVGALLPDRDAGLLVHAVALANWHATHRYCPRCGSPTQVSSAGSERRCPVDGSAHFPRTDPAVIVLVIDPADRALLGRQARWSPGRFSTLAGFVEPGEDAERAVRREVAEESGVTVTSTEYLGSQPWPFPASLMLGYRAWAADGRDPVVDGIELTEARWFARDEVLAGLGDGSLVLPPQVSIARRLVEHWYGGSLADAPGDWG
jgi:NAD+ diphosphatase